jgi:glycerophosphoryl diester phosphodiesterase
MRLRAEGRPLVVGHRGAAAHAPENTIASLRRASELSVDLVEFDVVALADGTLVLAHSDDLAEVTHGRASGRVAGRRLDELRLLAPELPTLDDALACLSGLEPALGAHVDLKSPGTEADVVEALRRHGMLTRAVVSSCRREALREVAGLEPELPRALTYPCARLRLGHRPAAAPVRSAALGALRAGLPARIAGLLRRADATVASLHWSVVSGAAVERAHAAGAAVFAWTVNDETALRRVLAANVDAVVTDDPTILEATLTQ